MLTRMEAWCPQLSFYFIDNKAEERKVVSSIIRKLNILDDVNLILMKIMFKYLYENLSKIQFPYFPTWLRVS